MNNFWYWHGDKIMMGGLAALVVFVLTAIVLGAIEDEKKWKIFAAEHDCKLIRVTKGETHLTTAYTNNGPVVATTGSSGTKTYLCNDGVEYVR